MADQKTVINVTNLASTYNWIPCCRLQQRQGKLSSFKADIARGTFMQAVVRGRYIRDVAEKEHPCPTNHRELTREASANVPCGKNLVPSACSVKRSPLCSSKSQSQPRQDRYSKKAFARCTTL